MRKLYSYRNRLSTRGTTTITDESGSNVYLINGRWGMHAGVMSVYSSSNLLEAEIKQRSLGMLPKFDLYKKRKYAGSIRRYYGVSREMLFVKKLNWLIMGNLSTYNYRVFHGVNGAAEVLAIGYAYAALLVYIYSEIPRNSLFLEADIPNGEPKLLRYRSRYLPNGGYGVAALAFGCHRHISFL